MNGEDDFHVENTEETERSPDDICVFLLDSIDTRLVNLSGMMRKCGYRVVATTRADDLSLIINNKDEKIDLVLAEFCLIEMNNYELLEKIRSICEIPVVVVGAYVKNAVILGCLCRGAQFCLKKPLMESEIENLCQFTVRRQRDFHSQIDTNPPEIKYSITHTQSLGDELNQTNKNNKVKTEDLDEYEGENFQSGDQKKPELICPAMRNEFRQTDEPSHGSKRKERAESETGTGDHTEKDYGSDLGNQKKPKLIRADDLQKRTLEAIPDIVEYEFEERDFQPLESVGVCVGHHKIPLSPSESSNKDVVGQRQMQKPQHRALDEEVIQDGISLTDLEFDLQEGQGSTSDLEKKAT